MTAHQIHTFARDTIGPFCLAAIFAALLAFVAGCSPTADAAPSPAYVPPDPGSIVQPTPAPTPTPEPDSAPAPAAAVAAAEKEKTEDCDCRPHCNCPTCMCHSGDHPDVILGNGRTFAAEPWQHLPAESAAAFHGDRSPLNTIIYTTADHCIHCKRWEADCLPSLTRQGWHVEHRIDRSGDRVPRFTYRGETLVGYANQSAWFGWLRGRMASR